MTHGGARPGAGRPRGARDRFSVELRTRLLEEGSDPAEVLAGLMADPAQEPLIRLRAAQALLPCVYPRLNVTDLQASVEAGISMLQTMIVDPAE